jgi:hypothetical protein
MVNKFLAAIIVLGVAIVLSLVLSAVIISRDAPELTSNLDWTPRPSPTVTPVGTMDPLPREPPALASSPTVGAVQQDICVHSVTYWAQHPELWPELVNIAGYVYSKEIVQAVFTSPTRDLTGELLTHLHAAYLNTLQTKAYPIVSEAIIESAKWINTHPAGSEINAEDQSTAISLGTILAEYNQGHLGYNPCGGDPAPGQNDNFTPPTQSASLMTVVPAGTASATATLTEAPASTSIRLPAFTPTPRQRRPRQQSGATQTAPPTQAPIVTPKPPNPTQAPLPTPVPTQIPFPTPAP